MRRTVAALLLALLACPAAAADWSGKVVSIADGDTCTVLDGERHQVKVRLYGIDAPEAAQPFGTRSRQALGDLVAGRTVTVHERDHDRYGRLVAEVLLPDGRIVNQELVRQGLAWHYVRFAPNDRGLAQLEVEARVAKRGLWVDPQPIAPWAWRQGEGGPATGPTVVIGNQSSHLYHRPTCSNVRKMAERNRREYPDAGEAEKAGFRRARCCR